MTTPDGGRKTTFVAIWVDFISHFETCPFESDRPSHEKYFLIL